MNISVIIPVWNRRQLLVKAVESVFAQTYLPKELILIDDGSDDGTNEYIADLRSDVLAIKKKHIPHCGMPGAVRNRGIELATKEWLAFLDSDDYWLPHKLEKQVAKIQELNALAKQTPPPRFCHTKEMWLRNGAELSQKKQNHVKSGYIFNDALKKCIIGPSTVLMHVSLVENYGMFNETLEIVEDYEYWLRICAREQVLYVEDVSVVKYSGEQAQLSKKYDYIENFRIQALEGLVHTEIFSNEQLVLAQGELLRKKEIWEQGKIKRVFRV